MPVLSPLPEAPNGRRAPRHRHAARLVRAGAPRHDAAALVTRLNRLAGDIRDRRGTVIFIQHDGPSGDPHHPDEPGWHLLPELDARPGDTVVRKKSCDAFLGTGLDEVLRAKAIDRLIIT